MIRPTPGYIWQEAARQRPAVRPPFLRAHSDMSGLSLFEKAHYQGMVAGRGRPAAGGP